MSMFEEAWLVYGRSLVLAGPELCRCSSMDREPRWPGFIGERYDKGRVLVVASVHFTSKLFAPAIRSLIPVTKASANGADFSDEHYLMVRVPHILLQFSVERSGVESVWQDRSNAWTVMGVRLFTNLAKCHMSEDDDEIIASCCRRFSKPRTSIGAI
jgi:hypothetical protein